MSIKRGFIVRMRGDDTTTVYLKPDGGYSVDPLNARVYDTAAHADPDLPAVRGYAKYTRVNPQVDVRAITVMAVVE